MQRFWRVSASLFAFKFPYFIILEALILCKHVKRLWFRCLLLWNDVSWLTGSCRRSNSSYSVIESGRVSGDIHTHRAELLLHVCVTESCLVFDSLNTMRKSEAFFCCWDVTLAVWSNRRHVVTHTKNSEPWASSPSSSARFLYSSYRLFTLFSEHSWLFVFILKASVHWRKGNCQKKETWWTMRRL